MTVTTRPELLWLFTAHFADGTSIEQDENDASTTREGGSAFTDVLAYQQTSPVVWFVLHHTATGEHVGVDLILGRFSHNDRTFDINDAGCNPENHDLELVYYRSMRAQMTPDGPRHYVRRYCLGWKCTVGGIDKKAIIEVA
jgi:hypothetical protein